MHKFFFFQVQHACAVSVDNAFCIELCNKKLECGHPCTARCGEPCKSCPACAAEIAKFKKDAQKRIDQLKASLRRKASTESAFLLEELVNSGATKAEFTQVTDRVEKYIQSNHNWIPNVRTITKVTNLQLEVKFEKAKSKAFGTNIDQKFHGTNNEGVRGIIREGFRKPGAPLPGKRLGMYGQGIYFATDSSKSAQAIYTDGSNKLLLCDVLLGKSMVVEKAQNTLNGDYIRKGGFDSVYAPRGTKSTGGVDNDEFVIYDQDQALPR